MFSHTVQKIVDSTSRGPNNQAPTQSPSILLEGPRHELRCCPEFFRQGRDRSNSTHPAIPPLNKKTFMPSSNPADNRYEVVSGTGEGAGRLGVIGWRRALSALRQVDAYAMRVFRWDRWDSASMPSASL